MAAHSRRSVDGPVDVVLRNWGLEAASRWCQEKGIQSLRELFGYSAEQLREIAGDAKYSVLDELLDAVANHKPGRIARNCLADFGQVKVPSFLDKGQWVLTLKPSDGLLDMKELLANPEGKHKPAQVISLLGVTTGGKSTISRVLLDLPPNPAEGDGGPLVLEDVTAGPTTAGCWHYYNSSMPERHVLDMEGMNGSDVMPGDWNKFCKTDRVLPSFLPPEAVEVSQSDDDYFDLRAAAAKEHLPRLAYIASDVLIFVAKENVWANRTVGEQVREAAEVAAPAGVDVINKPHCVIIWNAASSAGHDVESDTRQFLERQDRKGNIQRLYASVSVLRLHNWDKDPAEFHRGVARLKDLIAGLIRQRLQVRTQYHNLYNSATWGGLLTLALRKFHSPEVLRFNALLAATIAANQNALVGRAVEFFNQISEGLESFDFCALHATRFLACLTRGQYFQDIAEDPGRANLDRLREGEASNLAEMGKLIDTLAPCTSPCVLTRSKHGDYHEKTELAEATTFSGFFRRVGRFVGLSSQDTRGTFSGKGFPLATSKQVFQETVAALDRHRTVHATYLARAEIVRHVYQQRERKVAPSICVICTGNANHPAGCGHQFCLECFTQIKKLPNSQSDDYESILKLDSTQPNQWPTLCPICNKSLLHRGSISTSSSPLAVARSASPSLTSRDGSTSSRVSTSLAPPSGGVPRAGSPPATRGGSASASTSVPRATGRGGAGAVPSVFVSPGRGGMSAAPPSRAPPTRAGSPPATPRGGFSASRGAAPTPAPTTAAAPARGMFLAARGGAAASPPGPPARGGFASRGAPSPALPAPFKRKSAQPTHNAKALYDLTGEQDGDLSFRAGDLLNVTDDAGDWWTATNIRTGLSGIFSRNYCRKL